MKAGAARLWKLKRFLKPYWKSTLLAPLFMALEVLMDVLQPKYMALIVNNGVMKRDVHYILTSGGVMLGLLVIGLLAGVGCNVFASFSSMAFATDLREALFAKVQSFSFHDLDRFKTGTLVTRMTNDVVQLQTFVKTLEQMLVRAPGLALGSVIMALTISLRLGLVLLFAIPVLAVFLYFLIRFSLPLFSRVQSRLDDVNTVVQENLAGIRVVKAFVRASFEMNRFRKVNDAYTRMAVRSARVVAFNLPFMNLVMNVSIVAVLWYGGHQVWSGSLAVGDLVAFINYVTTVLSSLMMVSMILVNISQARVSALRVNEVLDTNPDIASPAAPSENGALHRGGRVGHVEFRDVSFSYGENRDRELVLRDVSFSAAPGETVAIVGSTGAGKSTLINLIPRLYDVSRGRVLVDGIDVREMDLHALRSHIGVVLQESILFTGTIRDNIRFGRPDATDEECEYAARVAQAHDFIASFAGGYDTVVGQRGVNLSGGQKQRIAIARALLVRPPILIMDDSTSALDLRTESRLQQAIKSLVQESTTLLIAQRISSVMDADKILVIEDGHIVGQGTHFQLLQTSGVYQDIYASQAGKVVAQSG